MNIESIKELYIKKILSLIPPQTKAVDYLMETLDISKVSAYRRLKGQLPFTFDEVIVLSNNLGVLLDDIIHPYSESNKAIVSFNHVDGDEIQEYFLRILRNYSENLEEQKDVRHRNTLTSINNIWLVYTLGYDNLFKFCYYKWTHLLSFGVYNKKFSEVSLSIEMIQLSHKIHRQVQSLKNTSFIVDKNLFLNTMKEVQYYYRRGLILENELFDIVKDIEAIIDKTEFHILSGYNKLGKQRTFFLSSINIYSNSMYIEYDDHIQSFFYSYSPSPIRVIDPKVCTPHKQWLESLKKYSVLITASNEIEQTDFLNRQRVYLDKLKNNEDLLYC